MMDNTWLLHALWIAIHVSGLLAAWSVRHEATNYRQHLAHGSFFLFLVLIGLLTVVGETYCLSLWPLSAATLGGMIVTAVVDFGTPQELTNDR